jgi:hypothetical protein
LLRVAGFSRLKHLLLLTESRNGGEERKEKLVEEVTGYVNEWLSPDSLIGSDHIRMFEAIFIRAIEEYILGMPHKIQNPKGRVVALGAKGKNAKRILPMLKDSLLEPSVLMDGATNGGEIVFDLELQEYDLTTLTNTDTVLVIPTKRIVVEEIKQGLRNVMVQQIVSYENIVKFTFSEYLTSKSANE